SCLVRSRLHPARTFARVAGVAWQLDLFGPPSSVGPEGASERAEGPEPVEVGHPKQLGLFAEALEMRRRGLAALRAVDAGAARRELGAALEKGGDLAPALRGDLAVAKRVARVLGDAAGAAGVESARRLRDGIGDIAAWPAATSTGLVQEVRGAL